MVRVVDNRVEEAKVCDGNDVGGWLVADHSVSPILRRLHAIYSVRQYCRKPPGWGGIELSRNNMDLSNSQRAPPDKPNYIWADSATEFLT